MATGRQTGDSMQDGLKKIGAQIAQMMALPDADLDFLSQLQMGIVQYLRSQGAPMGGMGGPQAGPGGPMPGGMPGGPGGMPGGPGGPGGIPPQLLAAMAGQQGGPGLGGATPGLAPQLTSPDELQRMLSQGQGTQ